MKNDRSVLKNATKFALAITAIFHPAVSLLEPSVDVISSIFKNYNQSITEIDKKISRRLNDELEQCVSLTLQSMREIQQKNMLTDTISRAMNFIDHYIKNTVPQIDAQHMTQENINHLIQNALNSKEVSTELYPDAKDLKFLYDSFHQEFEKQIAKFEVLSKYYNQHNINFIRESVNEIWREIELLKNCDSLTTEELKDILSRAFDNERIHNPSIEHIVFSESLLPCTKIEEKDITAIINKENKSVPINEFFRETWKSVNQNHISITGIGGSGKTVALFSQKYPVPTIYIPLRDLSISSNNQTNEYITEYIKENTLASSDKAYKTLLSFCDKQWNNGPQIIFLFDGLNEVNSSKLEKIIREIRSKWVKKPGVQLVFTSRYDINAKLQLKNLHQVQIEPLSTRIIEEYLLSENISIPEKSDCLWNLIDTPLMLMLYSKSESIRLSHDNEFANWRVTTNGGSIIWNFLQSELCKDSDYSKLECVVAIHFVAPLICYKMMKKNSFSVDTVTFREYITESLTLYSDLKAKNSLPTLINRVIDESEGSDIKNENFYNLLTKMFGLFRANGEIIQLAHHHFRDCLSAIHIIQIGENAKITPDEWKEDFDYYVEQFLCDLLATENNKNSQYNTWNKIWSFGYQKENNVAHFISKMLNIYKKAYGDDISQVDFCDVDLRNIPLCGFRLTENSKQHFVNTQLGQNTFFGTGHSDTVSAVSWETKNTYYISASHDCTIRIYDSNNNHINTLRNEHKHYIRCAKCSPTDENVIASAGDDQQLICWTRTKRHSADEQETSEWIPRVWGNCSNWIRSLLWDSEGKRIICGDGNGNIKMFNGNSYVEFEQKHKENVRYLAWLESDNICTIVSGSDDGTFCIWTENGKCILNHCLGNPITSINWIQHGTYLVVSTKEKVYFYRSVHRLQNDKYFISINLVKEIYGQDISCIASSNIESIDYMAVFDNSSMKIWGIINIDDELHIDELGSYRYDNQTNKIITAEWNNSCNRLICGSRDGSVSCVDILHDDENNQRIIFEIIGKRCCKAARCSSWSPNGEWLAIGYDDSSIRIWDPFRTKCLVVLKSHTDSVKCLAWSPDGSSLASGSDDNEVKIWAGTSIEKFAAQTVFKHSESVNALLWLKDHTIISAGDEGSIVFIYAGESRKILIKKIHNQRVYSLAVSPNETYMISGGNDNYIVLWDLKTLKYQMYKSNHKLPIRALAWSNNGEFVISSSNDSTINLIHFNTDKGRFEKKITSFPKMTCDFIYGANISCNNLYVIGGSSDSTVGIWKCADSSFIHRSNAHGGFVWNVSSSPLINNKSYIATSSSDGTVKIWNVSCPDINSFEPFCSLPVIPDINIIGCDFTGSIVEDATLCDTIITNGGIIS